jgi:thymidine kinase
MFAGKSSTVLQKVRRAEVLGWQHLVITAAIDTRYDLSGAAVVTHDQNRCNALGVKMLEGVQDLPTYKESKLVIIEEGQFIPDLYAFVIRAVEEHGKEVVVVGLDGDSDRKPFGDILRLVPLADELVRLTALCKRCGDGTAALFSALVKGTKESQVCVGGADRYEPMCRKHYLENSKSCV